MLAAIDLDGTLLRTDGTFDPADLAALEVLGRRGVVRVIATGRSLFSYRKALRRGHADRALPVDYVVFSTGCGVLRTADETILRPAALTAEEVRAATEVLLDEGVDFMVHDPIPENHRFAHHDRTGDNPDFLRRIDLYRDHCRPLAGISEATQLLAVLRSPGAHAIADRIEPRLSGFSVIRATSPLDGESIWLEIFPPGVSKGRAVARLAEEHGIASADALAVGNDTNDADLLDWAGESYVVENALPSLKERYPVVPGCDARGVSIAVERWLSAAGPAARGPITSRRS